MTNLRQYFTEKASLLKNYGFSGEREMEIFIDYVTDNEKALLKNEPAALSNLQKIQLDSFIARRLNNEPVAYIVGNKYFYGYYFKVLKGVFIPRYDTEIIVEKALEYAAMQIECERPRLFRIIEFCGGTGCISISLINELRAIFPIIKIDAVILDINPLALATIEENCRLYKLLDVVKIKQFDILSLAEFSLNSQNSILSFVDEVLNKDNNFDLFISNPPYIPSAEILKLEKQIKDYEPRNAFNGNEDGLVFYQIFTQLLKKSVISCNYAVWEIGDDQGNAVKELILQVPLYSFSTIYNDLQDKPRAITLVKARNIPAIKSLIINT